MSRFEEFGMGIPIKKREGAGHVYDGKAPWLVIRPPDTTPDTKDATRFEEITAAVKEQKIHTVCQEAHCPNIPECWSKGTFTFMVLGDVCTRACRFCEVKTASPGSALDPHEPEKIAMLAERFGMRYVVITSVNRDDLKDQGSSHFAECIRAVKRRSPETIVEVLIPDFRGDIECIKRIVDAGPEVVAHNLETVRRLTPRVRDPRAKYDQSLFVLKTIKEMNPKIITKSSLMLGLGESDEEVLQAFRDLREIGADIVTLGQYLRPSSWHLEIKEYVHPDKFRWFKEKAEQMGFMYAAAGPFVRSSYRAGEFFVEAMLKKQKKIEETEEKFAEAMEKKSMEEEGIAAGVR